MAKNKGYNRRSAAELRALAYKIFLLSSVLLGLAILLTELVYAGLPVTARTALDWLFAALWVVLSLESVLRYINRAQAKQKLYIWRDNKPDTLYLLASLFIVPLSIIVPALSPFRWVLVFKLPNVTRRFDDEKVFQVIVRLILGLLILFFVFPFLNVFAVSLSSPNEIVNIFPKGFTLYSVKYVLQDMAFFKSVAVSVFVTGVGTMISVVAMAMAAYPLSKKEMPLRKTVLMFFMIVMLFSGGMAPNILLVNSLHLTNTIWALIFPSVVMVFHLLLLKGFFESIPDELEESAKLDGANNYTILFRIIIPIAAPMIATVAFFTAINYWNNINNSILYITSNQSIYPLPMYIKNFLSRNPMDIAQSDPKLLTYWDNIKMSYILLSIVPIACAYPFIFKYLKNGVTVGSVKG